MAKKKNDKEKIKELKSEVSNLKKQLENKETNIGFSVKNSKPGIEIFIPMEIVNQDMSKLIDSYNIPKQINDETNELEIIDEKKEIENPKSEELIEEKNIKKEKPKYKNITVTGGVNWGKVMLVISGLIILAIFILVKLS